MLLLPLLSLLSLLSLANGAQYGPGQPPSGYSTYPVTPAPGCVSDPCQNEWAQTCEDRSRLCQASPGSPFIGLCRRCGYCLGPMPTAGPPGQPPFPTQPPRRTPRPTRLAVPTTTPSYQPPDTDSEFYYEYYTATEGYQNQGDRQPQPGPRPAPRPNYTARPLTNPPIQPTPRPFFTQAPPTDNGYGLPDNGPPPPPPARPTQAPFVFPTQPPARPFQPQQPRPFQPNNQDPYLLTLRDSEVLESWAFDKQNFLDGLKEAVDKGGPPPTPPIHQTNFFRPRRVRKLKRRKVLRKKQGKTGLKESRREPLVDSHESLEQLSNQAVVRVAKLSQIGTDPAQSAGCEDTDGNCQYWAFQHHCDNNRWMRIACPASCDTCRHAP